MDAASATLAIDYAWKTALHVAEHLENATFALTSPFQKNLAGQEDRLYSRVILLLSAALLFVAIARMLAWYCRTKARLDAAVLSNPDKVLADSELRALRRALLMVDVKRHIPRLFRKIRHMRAYNMLKAETRREKSRPLHLSKPRNLSISPPSSPTARKFPVYGDNEAKHHKLDSHIEKSLDHKDDDPNFGEKESESECLDLLRKHTLLKYVAPELLVKLAKNAREKILDNGMELFTAGNRVKCPNLYIVKSGAVQTYVKLPTNIGTIGAYATQTSSYNESCDMKCISCLGPGESISALLDLLATLCSLPIVSQVTAIAVSPQTIVYKWDHCFLAQMAKEDPVSIGRLVRMITVKLNRATFSTMYEYLGLASELTNENISRYNNNPENDSNTDKREDNCHAFLQGVTSHESLRNKVRDLISLKFGIARSAVPHISVHRKNDIALLCRLGNSLNCYSDDDIRFGGPSDSQAYHLERPKQDFDPVLRAASAHSPLKVIKKRTMKSSHSSETVGSVQKLGSAVKSSSYINTKRKQTHDSLNATDSNTSMVAADSLEVAHFKPGSTLAAPGDTPSLFMVLAGTIDLLLPMPNSGDASKLNATRHDQHSADPSIPEEDQSRLRHLYKVSSGGIVGLLPLQTGESWNMVVRCPSDSRITLDNHASTNSKGSEDSSRSSDFASGVLVVRVRRSAYASLVESHPNIVFSTAKLLLQRLSPLLHVIDYGLKWRHLQPGEILVRQGEICDSTHFVLHGRLRETYVYNDKDAENNDIDAQGMDSGRSSFSSEGYFIRDVQDVGSCAVAAGRTMIVDGRKTEKRMESGTNVGVYEKFITAGQNKALRYGSTARPSSVNLDSTPTTFHEYGRGSCIGEGEMLARTPHDCTICAIRESAIVEMPNQLFQLIIHLCPSVLQHVTKSMSTNLAQRAAAMKNISAHKPTQRSSSSQSNGVVKNISTIALLPITMHSDSTYLAGALSRSLSRTCKVARVSSDRISHDLDIDLKESKSDLDYLSYNKLALMSYLSQLEEMHSLVIYECDSYDNWPSDWTATCLRQADVVLLVANAFDPYDVTEFERWAVQHLNYAQNVLVLTHDMDLVERTREAQNMSSRQRQAVQHSKPKANHISSSSEDLKIPSDSYMSMCEESSEEGIEKHALWSGYRPRNTRLWFKARQDNSSSSKEEHSPVYPMGIQHHMHIRIYKTGTQLASKQHRVNASAETWDFDGFSPFSDCARLARWLTGTQVGLTLGGGGARGLAHVGTFEALLAAGIPVDVVGGTSQGAFIAALIAMIHNPRDKAGTRKALVRLSRKYAEEMSSNYAKIKDLTFPITSYFHGGVFNAGLMRHFGDIRIEDLWLDYFCISTDLTDSREVVHHSGMLWKYVRASMTLGPYLAPICEVKESEPDRVHYLVDGGYVNNLPADEMRRIQAPMCVIAVDVSSYYNFGGIDYGDAVSGWRQIFASSSIFCMFRCFRCCRRPGRGTGTIPSMNDISTQLAYVSNARQLPERLQNDISLYLKPGVAHFGVLQFGSFGAIRKIGYEHACKSLATWKKFLDENCDPLRAYVFLGRKELAVIEE